MRNPLDKLTRAQLAIGSGAAGVVLAFGAGAFATDAPDTSVEFIKVPVTKTVTAPAPEPEVVVTKPTDCVAALEYAERLYDSASDMYDLGDAQQAIISDARKTLADGGDLNAVSNEQRKLSGLAVSDLSILSEVLYNFEQAKPRCLEGLDD